MNDDGEEPLPCPACEGDAYPLGRLGMLVHYRCRHCGWTFHNDPLENHDE